MVIYDIQTTVDEETSHSGIKLNIQSEDVIVDEVGYPTSSTITSSL